MGPSPGTAKGGGVCPSGSASTVAHTASPRSRAAAVRKARRASASWGKGV